MTRPDVTTLFITAVLLTTLTGSLQAQEPPTETVPAAAQSAAQDTARTWLRGVDSGAFGRAWDDAATVLQGAVTRGVWRKQASQARTDLGSLQMRRQTQAQYRDSLRQVPEAGPFVLLAFRSRFDGGLYVETVLTVLEDGAWKVAAYRVAPVRAPSRRFGSSLTPRP